MMIERDAAAGPVNGGRVLALVDASRPSLAALEAAARLAARRRIELVVLFVEDIALVRSAAYAFSREIGAVSGSVRQLDAASMETRLRRQGDRARRALEKIAEAHGIAPSLSIRRGSVLDEIRALATPGDLLVLARVGWSVLPGRRLGSTARALVEESRVPVMLHHRPARRADGTVAALIDDAESARATIAFAAALARNGDQPLTVLLAPEIGANDVGRHVSDDNTGVPTRIRELRLLDPRAIAHALQTEHASTLVLSRRGRPLREHGIDELLALLDLPVAILP